MNRFSGFGTAIIDPIRIKVEKRRYRFILITRQRLRVNVHLVRIVNIFFVQHFFYQYKIIQTSYGFFIVFSI
ncbi:hypothetical protein AMJ80_06430 [bacterium SM23_31]|nr:MAG: hypothetical protein AMJ80_06430 [bacterium SM23_31]